MPSELSSAAVRAGGGARDACASVAGREADRGRGSQPARRLPAHCGPARDDHRRGSSWTTTGSGSTRSRAPMPTSSSTPAHQFPRVRSCLPNAGPHSSAGRWTARDGSWRTTTTPSTATTVSPSGQSRAWLPNTSSTGLCQQDARARHAFGLAGRPGRPRRRSRLVQGLARPRLAEPRPAGIRRLPRARRIRPPPAPDAADLSGSPGHAAESHRQAPARVRSVAPRPACTWSLGCRRASRRRH